MEKIHIKANLIVSLKDSYTNSTNLKGVVSVKTHNGISAFAKDDGCFVLINCPEGLYRIDIQGSCYQKQSFEIVMDQTVQVRYLTLIPNQKYPFSGIYTKLYGSLSRKAYMAFEPSDSKIRLLEQDGKNRRRVRLYLEGDGEVTGRQFDIVSRGKHFVNTLIDMASDGMWYEFEKELPGRLGPDAKILPVYRCIPDDQGNYFLPLKGKYEKVYALGEDYKKSGEAKILTDSSQSMRIDWKEK